MWIYCYILLQVSEPIQNPLEAIRPYYFFFSRHLNIGIDLFLCSETVPAEMEPMLQGSILLAGRNARAESLTERIPRSV